MEHRHDHDTHDNHGYYNKETYHTNDSHHDENDLHEGHDYYENQQYYYHPDHLGSSSYITDTKGKVYEHLEYFPYGETWAHEHYNTNSTPYKFTGKELDEETGLYYYGARYYDPRTSVWVSADPILDKYMPTGDKKKDKKLPNGGIYNPRMLGMYTYTANNPINLVDPSGKVWQYYSDTGAVQHTNDKTGEVTVYATTGYSGHGMAVNDSSKQNIKNTGPIPQGKYTIGKAEKVEGKGDFTMRLTPGKDTEMYSRDGMMIHGDKKKGPRLSASSGCIILSKNMRKTIANSGDTGLQVIAEKSKTVEAKPVLDFNAHTNIK